LLVDIYFDTLHVNNWLIDKKYAFSYDGGTKQTWADREDIETNDTADPPSSDNIPKPTHRLKFSFW
jgi:hypothetical protein